MKTQLKILPLLLLVMSTPAIAADGLPVTTEQSAMVALAEGIFDAAPEWEEKRGTKSLVWSKGNMVLRLTVSPETGHVIKLDSNGVPMTNARLGHLGALKELRELHFGHSGQWHFKQIPMVEFSGAGLEVLVDSKVEQLKIGGSHFGEAGMLAIAKMKSLKSLDFNHVPVTRAGMEAIARHLGITRFGVGMMHQTKARKGDVWSDQIPVLMTLPNLEQLSIREVFLTWDTGLQHIADQGAKLKRIEFGRGSVVFPEDAARLRQQLPQAEIVIEPYDRALNGNKHYAQRLRALMTEEQFARLEQLATNK